ncbi:MAG: hypothetical protein AAGF99_00980 [Bacteroidota bacterium]
MNTTALSVKDVFGPPVLPRRRDPLEVLHRALKARPCLERSDTDEVTLELLDLADAYPRHRSLLLSAVRHLNPDAR